MPGLKDTYQLYLHVHQNFFGEGVHAYYLATYGKTLNPNSKSLGFFTMESRNQLRSFGPEMFLTAHQARIVAEHYGFKVKNNKAITALDSTR